MVAAGSKIYASDVLRARPKRFYDETTGSIAASQSAVVIPGISISFTTETDNAELDLVWFVRMTQAASAAATAVSARPLVVGPSGFSQSPSDYAYGSWGTNAGSGATVTMGNSYVMTLGVAGTYTVTVLATTGTQQGVGSYSSLKCVLQEQFS
jgi:hypothetical protein